MPSGLGGTIAGTVPAASSGEPVGRILVDALRPDADGGLRDGRVRRPPRRTARTRWRACSRPATCCRFTADGFDPIFYPGAAGPGRRRPGAGHRRLRSPPGKDVVITGQPGLDHRHGRPRRHLQPVRHHGHRPGHPGRHGRPGRRHHHDRRRQRLLDPEPAGARGLRAELRRRRLPADGGDHLGGRRRGPDPADRAAHRRSNGQITGIVTDGTAPLGGATVSTTVGGTAVTTGTPTTGDVGQFVLGDLPTPATYVLTVSGTGLRPDHRRGRPRARRAARPI